MLITTCSPMMVVPCFGDSDMPVYEVEKCLHTCLGAESLFKLTKDFLLFILHTCKIEMHFVFSSFKICIPNFLFQCKSFQICIRAFICEFSYQLK